VPKSFLDKTARSVYNGGAKVFIVGKIGDPLPPSCSAPARGCLWGVWRRDGWPISWACMGRFSALIRLAPLRWLLSIRLVKVYGRVNVIWLWLVGSP
jgi:hypothetical protein